MLFLVGAFPFKEKCLTLTATFSDHRPQTTQAKSGQCKLSAKGRPFLFLLFKRNLQNRTRLKGPPFDFYRRCATFFRKFFHIPLSSFFIFCNGINVNTSQRVPTLSFYIFKHLFLHFLAVCDIFLFFLFQLWKTVSESNGA